MKLKIYLTAIIMTAISALLLTACNNQNNVRVVSSGETPERIIATAPSIAEVLVGFGLADHLIAVEMHGADIPGLNHEITAFMDFWTINAEEILMLNPDLVVVSQLNSPSAGDPYAIIRNAGIEVVYIDDPISIYEIFEQIELLGEVTARQREAAVMIYEMETTLRNVESRLSSVTEPRRVYFEISPAPGIFTFGNGTFLNELLSRGGGINVFEDQDGWFAPSEEFIILSDPDVIMTNVMHIENSVDEIKSRPGWWSISAIINEEVHLINTNYTSRHSQYVVRAVEQIAAALYPELFR